MGCYAITTAAALVHYIIRKKNPSMGKEHKVLNQLLMGGSIFGIVDHAINGELLSFTLRDTMLGVLITAVIIMVWSVWNLSSSTVSVKT